MSQNKTALKEQDINQALSSLDGWSWQDDALTKTFTFDNFIQAFGFMTQVAIKAETMAHHPTWENTYNSVDVKLSTHDAGDIVTQLDIDLATFMNQVASAAH